MSAALGAAAISGGGGLLGTWMTNEANAKMQHEANQWSAAIAAENRQWQERMSNTAHQREVSDLRAAGLNPILSATRGTGASTPSGNAPQMQAARMENVIGSGLSSAKDAYSLALARESTTADVALKDASVAQAAASTAASISSAKKLDAETTGIEVENANRDYESRARRSKADLDELRNRFDKDAATYDAIMNRAEQASGMVGNLVPAGKLIRSGVDAVTRSEHKSMKEFLNRKPRGR